MTYPPQNQPDPWGQQQGPNETWVQQPDQWGQQQPPPPQDPWGGGGGYDGYGQPPKKGGGKTLAIVLVVVVVLAGAGVGLFFWLKNKDSNDNAAPGGTNPNDPKSVAVAWADKYQRAYNSDYQEVKASDLKPLMCQSQYTGLDEEQQEADAKRGNGSSGSAVPTPNHRKYKLTVGDVKANGDTATAMVTATPESASGANDGPSASAASSKPETRAFDMKKENGAWKVCGPQSQGGNGGGGNGPAPSGGVPLPGGGGSGAPAPSGSLKPLPSGIPIPTH
jgi:hypothetical protein